MQFDPLAIEIKQGSGNGSDGNADPNSLLLAPNPLGQVYFNDLPHRFLDFYDTALAASNTNILLQAANSITINDLGGALTLQSGVNITLETRNGSGDSATGGITFLNTTNGLQTTGSGTITLAAGVNAATDGTFTQTQGTADITAGSLSTAGGAITVVASRNVTPLMAPSVPPGQRLPSLPTASA